jgi:hydroxymethylpyrimidine pyrophosphatase-like HAD family hydrolase
LASFIIYYYFQSILQNLNLFMIKESLAIYAQEPAIENSIENKKKYIGMIALDLDGTVEDMRGEKSKKTGEYDNPMTAEKIANYKLKIMELKNMGYGVAVITGRPIIDAKKICPFSDLVDYWATENGGNGIDSNNQKLFKFTFDKRTASMLTYFLCQKEFEQDLNWVLFDGQDGRNYVFGDTSNLPKGRCPNLVHITEPSEFVEILLEQQAVSILSRIPLDSFGLLSLKNYGITQGVDEYPVFKGISIIPDNSNKMSALQKILEDCDIPLEGVIFAGNDGNDSPILSNEEVGTRILVGNNKVGIPNHKLAQPKDTIDYILQLVQQRQKSENQNL